VAHSRGSTSPLLMSSGPTTLTSTWYTHVPTSIPRKIQRLGLSPIYGEDIFNFGVLDFIILRLANTRFLSLEFPGCLNADRQPRVFPPMDGLEEFWDFMYHDFHVLVQLQRVFFKTLCTFSISDGHEVSPFLPNRS
jgi:hypothetical protein